MTQETKDILFLDVEGVNFDFSMEMNRHGSTFEEMERSPIFIGFKIDSKMSATSSFTVLDHERMKLFTSLVKRMARLRVTISEICETKEET